MCGAWLSCSLENPPKEFGSETIGHKPTDLTMAIRECPLDVWDWQVDTVCPQVVTAMPFVPSGLRPAMARAEFPNPHMQRPCFRPVT